MNFDRQLDKLNSNLNLNIKHEDHKDTRPWGYQDAFTPYYYAVIEAAARLFTEEHLREYKERGLEREREAAIYKFYLFQMKRAISGTIDFPQSIEHVKRWVKMNVDSGL